MTENIETDTKRSELRALTGARFVAALSVVLFHNVRFESSPIWINRLVGHGGKAVVFFFVLSGFILTYTYLESFRQWKFSLRSFFVARLARIYPVYLLGLIIALPFFFREVWHHTHGSIPTSVRESAVIGAFASTLTQAWFPVKPIVWFWNTPGWSLSVEAFLYLLFPILLIPFRRASVVNAWVIFTVSVVVAGLLVPTTRLLPTNGRFCGISGAIIYGMHPLANLPSFLMGMSMAVIFAAYKDRKQFIWTMLGVISLMTIVVAGTVFDASTTPSTLDFLLQPAFALIVIALAFGGAIANFALSNRSVIRLGEASYALYILHAPLWAIYQQVYCKVFRGLSQTIGFDLGYLALSLTASLAVFRWIEKPCRDALRHRLSRVHPELQRLRPNHACSRNQSNSIG